MEKLENRGELQNVIAENAATNPEYRDTLLKNPRGLLEAHLGQDIPDWLKVKVVEETADTIYLIAPHVPGEELADEDLEMVAGGKGDSSGSSSSGTSVAGNANCGSSYGAFNSVINIQSSVQLGDVGK